MVFDDVWRALLPALIQVSFHLVEANAITPTILGRRLTMNPLLILVSLTFWGWVWGTPGALLGVPLLIIIQTVVSAAGTPDIAGFLFERGQDRKSGVSGKSVAVRVDLGGRRNNKKQKNKKKTKNKH